MTKSGEHQTVCISDVLREYLIELKSKAESEYVISEHGHRIHELRKSFRNLLNTAGVYKPGYCIHTLRHTLASHLVMHGTDLTTIKDLLRHQSIQTTMRYTHLSQAHTRSELAKISMLTY